MGTARLPFPSFLTVANMHKPKPNVLGIFQEPNRESSLEAISRALLRIHANHNLTWKKLAKKLDVHADTLAGAVKGHNLLSFDSVARLGFYFPDEFELIETLWLSSVSPVPTIDDRLDAIESEVAAIRREVA